MLIIYIYVNYIYIYVNYIYIYIYVCVCVHGRSYSFIVLAISIHVFVAEYWPGRSFPREGNSPYNKLRFLNGKRGICIVRTEESISLLVFLKSGSRDIPFGIVPGLFEGFEF